MASILFQTDFALADFPELVELAVIGTGLGMPRNKIEFVKQVPVHWDSTHWGANPRPFLDSQAQAYANALAAWSRREKQPDWLDDLALELRKPTRKSLKHLWRTDDSFFRLDQKDSLIRQAQTDWLHLADDASDSKQIIAVRHFENDENLASDQEDALLQKLRSSNRYIVLHALAAVDYLGLTTKSIQNELSYLIESSDDELRAKSMIALTRMGPLDELSTEQATKMVGSQTGYVSFAGVFGLLTKDKVDDDIQRAVDRGFRRALQTCDYEFVELFASAYTKWMDRPNQYLQTLLADDQPEYLEIALNAIEDVQQKLVSAP